MQKQRSDYAEDIQHLQDARLIKNLNISPEEIIWAANAVTSRSFSGEKKLGMCTFGCSSISPVVLHVSVKSCFRAAVPYIVLPLLPLPLRSLPLLHTGLLCTPNTQTLGQYCDAFNAVSQER